MHRTRRRFRLVTIAVLVAGFAHPVAAMGETIHSSENDYAIDLPDGWVRIPDTAAKDMMGATLREDTPVPVVYEFGFQHAGADDWFVYPYVLVQILPYESFGVRRQLYEDELYDFTNAVTGADVGDAMDDYLSDEVKGGLSTPLTGEALLNRDQRCFQWSIHMTVAGIGPVRGRVVGFFGRRALVQILHYAIDEDATSDDEIVARFKSGFSFDPSAAYDDALARSTSSGVLGLSAAVERRGFLAV